MNPSRVIQTRKCSCLRLTGHGSVPSFGSVPADAKPLTTAERNERTEKRKITELWVPNTVTSSVDRTESRFLAVVEAGTQRSWIDEDMVHVRQQGARVLRRLGGQRTQRAALTSALICASAATSAVETYRDPEIAPEQRTRGVQLNESLSGPAECRLEEVHRAC